MKNLLILPFILLSIIISAQKRNKNALYITSNIEAQFVLSKAFGNNSLAKNYGVFYGFGFGGQLLTPINWGIGADYTFQHADVKPGRQNYVGNLGAMNLSTLDVYLLHKNKPGEDFYFEKSIGFSFYSMKSNLYPSKDKYSEGKGGINAGLKGIFNLDREEKQQFALGIKGHYYLAGVNNENTDIERFYNKSFIVGLTFGYRYNF